MKLIAGWGVAEWTAVGSALVALVSFALNWALIRRQNRLQFEALKAQMDVDTLAWAHGTIDLISDAVGLARGRGVVYGPDEFRRRAIELGQRISSAADRGRLYFPNESPERHGQHKEAAFQGHRPPIIDAVVFACTAVEWMAPDKTGPDTAAAEFLIKCRRLLVSEAQNAIDPRRRRAMLRALAEGREDDVKSSFRIAAELGEALEARREGYLEIRRDEAWILARERLSRSRKR